MAAKKSPKPYEKSRADKAMDKRMPMMKEGSPREMARDRKMMAPKKKGK